MTEQLAALILLITALLVHTQEVPHPVPITVVELGDTVMLKCSTTGEKIGLIYWYKLNFVYLIQTVVAGTFDKLSLKGQFDNPRFEVTKKGLDYFLKINNVSKEDEATYFCQAGSAYTMTIRNGTILAVNDETKLEDSVYVKQSPDMVLVEPSDSVTIQCSLLTKKPANRAQCSDGHSVYWFRSGPGGLNSNVIYIHKSRNKQQNGRSCSYSFTKTIQNASDAGTYYCAVVMCGEILFGDGTTVDTTVKLQIDPVVVILGVLLAVCVILIAVLVLERD